MTNVAIPKWNAQGFLAPIDTQNPTGESRSPYLVSLADLVLHYGLTPKRQAILQGFLEFRTALHTAGIVKGFQWLDGSFLENIELFEHRAPNDIDVVTFFHLPNGETQENLVHGFFRLFQQKHTKQDFQVDAYYVQLNGSVPEPLVQQTTYWYSLWSHRRNSQWKGYVQIDLAPTEDTTAKANLDLMMNPGGQV